MPLGRIYKKVGYKHTREYLAAVVIVTSWKRGKCKNKLLGNGMNEINTEKMGKMKKCLCMYRISRVMQSISKTCAIQVNNVNTYRCLCVIAHFILLHIRLNVHIWTIPNMIILFMLFVGGMSSFFFPLRSQPIKKVFKGSHVKDIQI